MRKGGRPPSGRAGRSGRSGRSNGDQSDLHQVFQSLRGVALSQPAVGRRRALRDGTTATHALQHVAPPRRPQRPGQIHPTFEVDDLDVLQRDRGDPDPKTGHPASRGGKRARHPRILDPSPQPLALDQACALKKVQLLGHFVACPPELGRQDARGEWKLIQLPQQLETIDVGQGVEQAVELGTGVQVGQRSPHRGRLEPFTLADKPHGRTTPMPTAAIAISDITPAEGELHASSCCPDYHAIRSVPNDTTPR